MGDMSVLDVSGDIKYTWDSDKPDEVEHVRKAFTEMKRQGFIAYKVKRNGEKGEVIREFDPDAEMIIMSKGLVGG